MTDLGNKILNIVDEDIRNLFFDDNFPLGLPLQMQLIKSLQKLIPILEEQIKNGNKSADNGCWC